MSLIYRYKLIKRPEVVGDSRSPMIPLILKGNKRAMNFMGLLDSGADYSVMPKDLAEFLGVDLSAKPEHVRGLSEETTAIPAKINIVVQKGHEKYKLLVEFRVIKNADEDIPLIIGRKDFFENFKITFNESEEKITLKKVNLNIDSRQYWLM